MPIAAPRTTSSAVGKKQSESYLPIPNNPNDGWGWVVACHRRYVATAATAVATNATSGHLHIALVILQDELLLAIVPCKGFSLAIRTYGSSTSPLGLTCLVCSFAAYCVHEVRLHYLCA